jgi:hypothetical protein
MNQMAPWVPTHILAAEDEQPDHLVKAKLSFARLIATAPDNHEARYRAARTLFWRPDQEGFCQQIANSADPVGWSNDPVVICEMARLKREANGDDLPGKQAVARSLLNLAEDTRFTLDARLKAYHQYCELMGLNPSKNAPAGGNVTTNIIDQRVFVVPQELDQDAWQERSREIRKRQIEMTVNSVETDAD